MSSRPEPAPDAARMDRLDALRGVAIVWMAAYHFCFDLNLYRLWAHPQNFYAEPFWTVQRTAIVSLFLLCAGLGQSVALAGVPAVAPMAARFGRGFWKRWAQVAACALLVSAGSAVMFPRGWISFGVLHGIAVMLLLCRLAWPLARPGWPLVLLGAVALALPWVYSDAFFDTRLTNWVGLITRKPITEDYVPVLPWLGVMLWGLACGAWLLRHRRPVLAGAVPAVLRPLAVLGRWSLTFYMLHQLVFIGALQAGRNLKLW